MSKEQQELLDEVYENFIDKTKGLNLNLEINRDIIVVEGPVYNATPRLLSKEEFIGRVITNPDFAKQWGVTIYTVVEDGNTRIGINYNNKTIESYE